MNESPWQPPTDDRDDARADVPADDRSSDAPSDGIAGADVPPPAPHLPPVVPSPWSPEGVAAAGQAPPPPPPTTPAPTTPPPSTSDAPFGEPTGAAVEGTVLAPQPETPRRRSKVLVGGAVAAVAALGLAGLFAVQRFTGEAAGGASSADQLGLDLLAAIEAEDVLGVIDTMLPGERDSLGDPFVEMVGELQRLEVLSADTDLSRLVGLDVELAGEDVQVRTTNVADIVNVSLAADATITLDGSTLPIGSFVEDQLPDDALAELRDARETESDTLELELTAVQEGDRWYFSVFHTVAELARVEAGDEPIPADGIVPAGGDSPEAAVDLMLDRIEQLDLAGMIATLDPAEAAALQRYAPLFLDVAQAELDQAPLGWRIDHRELRIEGDGDERTVFVDALGISGDVEGEPFSFGFADGCVRGEFAGDVFEECGAVAEEELDSLFADAPAIEAFAASVEDAFADLEPIGLELRRRDGAWYVSPLATGNEAVLAVMRALDRGELDTLVVDGTAAAEEFFDVFLGGFGFAPDILFEDEFTVPDEPFGDDEFGDGTVEEPGESATPAWDECYTESVAAEASACFERYVASGEIDPISVPTVLLFPECGLAELSWEGGLYGVTDEEFAKALETAVPCFRGLVERGEIEEWMLPF
ncbi:MAG: hypothetical protein ACLGHQ_00120, partial [Acidimicrobiia bacterium]